MSKKRSNKSGHAKPHKDFPATPQAFQVYDHFEGNIYPLGLTNIGNTCFLNSILQFLYAVQQMRSCLISKYGKNINMKGAKFAKLIGKLFSMLQQRSKEQQKICQILSLMMARLQQINTQYSRYSQEDALQTLLSILLQIEEKHPEAITIFDIDYKAFCYCSSFVTRERVLSICQNSCAVCNQTLKRIFLCIPQYLIYSNPSKAQVAHYKIQEFQSDSSAGDNKQKYRLSYRLIAQIIYMGSGRSGHYIANRIESNKLYQFNDSSVRQIATNNMKEIKQRGLILLYQLAQKQKIGQNKLELNQIYLFEMLIDVGNQPLKKQIFLKIVKGESYNFIILNKPFPYVFWDSLFDGWFKKIEKQQNQEQKLGFYLQKLLNQRFNCIYKNNPFRYQRYNNVNPQQVKNFEIYKKIELDIKNQSRRKKNCN